MNPKVLFTLFPKGYWISIGAGIILCFIGGQAEVPGNILINFGLFIIAFRMAVIVHEAGKEIFVHFFYVFT